MHVDMKALASLTIEREIPLDRLIGAIEAAVLTAYMHTPEARSHARAHLDPITGEIPVIGNDWEWHTLITRAAADRSRFSYFSDFIFL